MKTSTLAVSAVLIAMGGMSANADDSFSAELLLGSADQEVTLSDSSGSSSVSDNSTSFGLRGVYQFNEYVGVEFGYHDFGEGKETYIDDFGDTINDRFETTSLNFGVKGVMPFENGVSLVGRLGLSAWDWEGRETDTAFPGEVFAFSDDGTDLYYGLGVQYNFSEAFYVGLEYTVLDFDLDVSEFNVDPTDPVSADNDVRNLTLSIGWTF